MTDRLSVLHVMEAIEGGTARHLADLVAYAEGIRHHVAIPNERVGGVTDRAAVGAIRAAGGDVHTVEMRRSPAHWGNARALARLRWLIRDLQPDVVHAHSSIGGALGRVAALGSPSARVYTPHGVLTRFPYVTAERALGHITDRLIAVSESEGALVCRLGLVPEGRVVVVPNGISMDPPPGGALDLRHYFGLPANLPLVGCVSRLFPQKAPLDFIRVCALVADCRPDVHFVLIGSGPHLAHVEREVADKQLGSRFHHLPAVPTAALVLSQLQVLVNPSRFEGLPYTPLEAVRAGTPVVLSDAVGNRDVVEDGVSGFVRPVGDVAGMADAVVRLLDNDALGRSLTQAARRRLGSQFDVRDMGLATAEEYARVVADVRSGGRARPQPAMPAVGVDEGQDVVVDIHRTHPAPEPPLPEPGPPAAVIEFRRPARREQRRGAERHRSPGVELDGQGAPVVNAVAARQDDR